jgi:peptidoglycan/LPS O-acetylase OafA/YrhL
MSDHAEPVSATGAGGMGQTALVRFKDTEASVLLDLVRGLAALLVVSEHLRNLLFVDYRSIRDHRSFWMVPYLITGAGHQAVVFFVLSGYLISGTIFRALQEKAWSWRLYLAHRFLRLWIVLVPGLLLCTLWDSLGMRLGHAQLMYAGLNGNHLTRNTASQLRIPVFLGNLFFSQCVPFFGSDGSLWSLPYEAWYYVAFPIAWLLWVRYGSWRIRLLHAAVLMGVLLALRSGERSLFPVWLAGVVLVKLPTVRCGASARWAASCVYLALLFALSKAYSVSAIYRDFALAAATVLLLWVLLSARDQADDKAPLVRFSRGIARFSFTLYVAHLPMAVLLTSLLAGDGRWYPNAGHLAEALGILAVVMVYCWELARATEFHTDGVRRWIEAKLKLTRRAAAQPQAVQ